jgi:hypothetical protein
MLSHEDNSDNSTLPPTKPSPTSKSKSRQKSTTTTTTHTTPIWSVENVDSFEGRLMGGEFSLHAEMHAIRSARLYDSNNRPDD